MSQTASIVVIIQPVLTAISDRDIEAALAPLVFGLATQVVRLDDRKLTFDELAELDWAHLHEALGRELDTKLTPVLGRGPGSVHYFGMLPIPLAIEVGRRLGSARPVHAYQQRHDSKDWRWPAEVATVRVKLLGAPEATCHARGEVIIRVTCSHLVSIEDARKVVPFAIGELHVEVDAPHEDVLQSEADVTLVAAKFGEALDCVRQHYPNCDGVNVFAAVPPAVALRLGAEINPTIHKPVQTYQFNGRSTPRYRRAILVGERPRPEPSSAQREAAGEVRRAFANSLAQLSALGTTEPSPGWIDDLVGSAGAILPEPLKRLGPLGSNNAIIGARVDLDVTDAAGEFRFDRGTRTWVFDDRLLAALGERLVGAQFERAGRLFLLHEAIHEARQGLTSATSERVGRLPRVLEEADYLADLWALLHEYARAVRAGETDEHRAAQFFRELLALVTATFWAFDAAELPLRAIQVRRLNRYLIWYWQRLALEGANSLSEVLRILGTKPVLEVSGPRVSTSQNRVMMDLDAAHFDGVELGVLAEGFRLVRIGARPGAQIDTMLEALRKGDEGTFLRAFRGAFESAACAAD